MVSKITIFEPHFEGAQFGPASIETGRERTDDSERHADDESDSKSRLTMFVQGASVFGVLFVVLWILLSDDEQAE